MALVGFLGFQEDPRRPAARSASHHFRGFRQRPAQGRQRELRRRSGRRGDLAQAGDPAQDRRPCHGGKQRPIRKDTVVGLEFQGLTGVVAIIVDGRRRGRAPVPLDEDGVPTLTADLPKRVDPRHPAQCRPGSRQQPGEVMKDALLSFETYTATLADKGDAIDSMLRKADAAFAASTARSPRSTTSCPASPRARTANFPKGEVDSRTGRELQQAFGRLHRGRSPLPARYRRGGYQGQPEIRRATRKRRRRTPGGRPTPEASHASRALRAQWPCNRRGTAEREPGHKGHHQHADDQDREDRAASPCWSLRDGSPTRCRRRRSRCRSAG